MRQRSTSWSAADDARLMAACGNRATISETEWKALGKELGRSWKACRMRRTTLGHKANGTIPDRFKPRKGKVNGRIDRRGEDKLQTPPAPQSLPRHTSITAAFFGDPLPGRSALDKRPVDLSRSLPDRSPVDQMHAGLA